MHIVLHTQYYPPEIGAPQARLSELAQGLESRGFKVTVLTSMPSYPIGKIFPGYGGFLRIENQKEIKIIRTYVYPTQSAGLQARLFNYFSFVFSSLLVGLLLIRNADYILTESPPLFLGMSGYLISRLKRAKWIFNVSDLWPESVAELGLVKRESLSYRLSSVLEKSLYKKAWVVSGQSKTILENILQRFPDIHTYHLPNGVDTSLFRPGDERKDDDKFCIVYAGLHGLAQGLEQILRAANKLTSEECITYTFIGDGPEKHGLIQLAKDLNLSQASFLEPLPKIRIPEILNNADVLIVPLKIQLTGAVPSKLYEVMSMGKPVILIGGSEAAQIVKKADCGIIVRPSDIDSLVEAILYLKSNPEERKRMGANGRKAAIQNHDRTYITNQFVEFLTKESTSNSSRLTKSVR
jgi:glycosyltransferase involved in cell wall biosynthesis